MAASLRPSFTIDSELVAVTSALTGPPTITNDGVTIAREIQLANPFENMGAQLVKEVANKTNDVAGDGTTTATVLAEAILREGYRSLTAGTDAMALARGIRKAVDAVLESLKKQSKPIKAVAGPREPTKVAVPRLDHPPGL